MERKLICVLEDIEREIKRHVVNEKPPHDNVAVILYAHLVAVELALKESKEKLNQQTLEAVEFEYLMGSMLNIMEITSELQLQLAASQSLFLPFSVNNNNNCNNNNNHEHLFSSISKKTLDRLIAKLSSKNLEIRNKIIIIIGKISIHSNDKQEYFHSCNILEKIDRKDQNGMWFLSALTHHRPIPRYSTSLIVTMILDTIYEFYDLSNNHSFNSISHALSIMKKHFSKNNNFYYNKTPSFLVLILTTYIKQYRSNHFYYSNDDIHRLIDVDLTLKYDYHHDYDVHDAFFYDSSPLPFLPPSHNENNNNDDNNYNEDEGEDNEINVGGREYSKNSITMYDDEENSFLTQCIRKIRKMNYNSDVAGDLVENNNNDLILIRSNNKLIVQPILSFILHQSDENCTYLSLETLLPLLSILLTDQYQNYNDKLKILWIIDNIVHDQQLYGNSLILSAIYYYYKQKGYFYSIARKEIFKITISSFSYGLDIYGDDQLRYLIDQKFIEIMVESLADRFRVEITLKILFNLIKSKEGNKVVDQLKEFNAPPLLDQLAKGEKGKTAEEIMIFSFFDFSPFYWKKSLLRSVSLNPFLSDDIEEEEEEEE